MGVTHRIRSYIPEHVIADGIVNFCTWYRMVSVIVFFYCRAGSLPLHAMDFHRLASSCDEEDQANRAISTG